MINKKIWKFSLENPDAETNLIEKLKISKVIASLLVNRGIVDEKEAYEFLNSRNQAFLDPFLLKGMDRSIKRITNAIKNKEKITVYGDYDVDGITATAVLVRVLTLLGAIVTYYIPERQNEGYGLNENAMERIIEDGTNLLITVDCGVSSVMEVARVNNRLDVIITDHHRPPEILPDAFAVINPKQLDCLYPDKEIAGVGVAYKLCQALWKTIKSLELREYLDIVALGTIADIVPLTGENRLIVTLGLEQLNCTMNLGLQSLIKHCGLAGKKIDAGKVGFVLAPRLNAAGRIDSALTGVQLLLTDDLLEADRVAEALENDNVKRQLIEKDILLKAEESLKQFDMTTEKVIIISGVNWHSGVIGIVASRLVDKYYKPVIVISETDGIGKGSCRSIQGFDIYKALTKCNNLLEKFGGHAQAAGLSILPENIPLLRQQLTEIAKKVLTVEDYVPKIRIDAIVTLNDINQDFVKKLECLEPYGMGNPRPIFACTNLALVDARPMGQEGKHLRFRMKEKGQITNGIAWGMGELAPDLIQEKNIDLAFQPEINEWQGKCNVQLKAYAFRDIVKTVTELDELYLTQNEVEPYKNIAEAESFFTKVVGVTFDNRQQLIARLITGQLLEVKRQKDNQFDINAIVLQTTDGNEIGFLKADIAKFLAPVIDSGVKYQATVTMVTGQVGETFGVNIFVYKEQKEFLENLKYQQIALNDVRKILIGDREYHKSQQEALECLKQNQKTLVIMGTGRGKSAIFQTHAAMLAINQRKMTIIIYPLRALVNDQYNSLTRKLKLLGISIYKGNGTLSTRERATLFEALQNESVDVLLTTPEFMESNINYLKHLCGKIGFVVIDECHHIAEGHKRSAYKRIGETIKKLGNPLVLGVTATADQVATQKIKETLLIDNVIIDRTLRQNLQVYDARNTIDKLAYIKSIIKPTEKLLIFVNSRNKAVEIASNLRELYPALQDAIGFYHAGLSNEWRVKVEEWFKEGTLQVVVATSAFGEGIDLPDIRHVVQYHLPFDITTFNQQCGRAGRDGSYSLVHFIFGKDDIKLNNLILKERAPEREFIGKFYLILKSNHKENLAIELTNNQIAEQFIDKYHGFLGESGVSICLKILEELGLIWRETFHSKRKIYFNAIPSEKLRLEDSNTYIEGMIERKEFNDFSDQVMNTSQENLLTWINKPIYPEY
jgi:single-stranded-DNA-specific exonuclease